MGTQEQTPDPIRPADVARDDVVVSANRCPFCHTDVNAAEVDNVACKACLARHHQSCWEEAGKCSACGGGEALVSQATTQAQPNPETQAQIRRRLVAIVAGALLAMSLVFLLSYTRSQSGSEGSPPPRQEAPEAPVAPPVEVAPPGTFELDLQQRSASQVLGVDGLQLWVADVKATSETQFTLSFLNSEQGYAVVSLRVGESREVTLEGRRFRVRFVRMLQRAFGEDRAVVWITPL